MKYVCRWCNKEFNAPPSMKRKFCSPECNYKFQSKKYNPEGYHRRPHLSEMNRELNPIRMTDEVKTKLCLLSLGKGNKKSYQKLKGKHIHRIIAEMKIGRPLKKGEIVHHIDGDKRNNDPSNLEVLPSQKEHARMHIHNGRFKSE